MVDYDVKSTRPHDTHGPNYYNNVWNNITIHHTKLQDSPRDSSYWAHHRINTTEAHVNLHTARQQALHRTNHYHQWNKIKYDNNRVDPDFAVGESVLVKNLWQAGDGKLKPFYSGPFKIIERTSPVTMKINQKRKGCTTSIVHVSKIKRYRTPEEEPNQNNNDDDDDQNIVTSIQRLFGSNQLPEGICDVQ